MASLVIRRGAGRDYPPLLIAVAVMLALLVILPSSLNLPQPNPTQTLEYAPIPPEDGDDPRPPSGNFGSLSLAGSGSLRGTGAAGPGPGGGVLPGGVGKSPSTKRCVGNPPRQTNDPMAPPCVAYFSGDNFGATHLGVTGSEVRVLFLFDPGTVTPTSRGQESNPPGTFWDLAAPPTDDDPFHVRVLRAMQRYFNDRYQTYDRFVHFFVHYASANAQPPEGRRSDGVEAFRRVRPFAVFSYGGDGSPTEQDEYLRYMWSRGVLSFGGNFPQPAAYFRQFEKQIWGYNPTIEEQARQYATFVCRKAVPYPVSFSGNAEDQGKPRRFGLLKDAGIPGGGRLAQAAEQQIRACGANVVAEAVISTAPSEAHTVPVAMADFRQKGVTTVLWIKGNDLHTFRSAANMGYTPEWILVGDKALSGWSFGQLQDQTELAHAWVTTNLALRGGIDDSYCYQALREGDPAMPRQDTIYVCETQGTIYEDLRQLSTGIQVAGPRLAPASIDEGFRAIPPHESSNPRMPACYYVPGNYTCVKDAVAMWWDVTMSAPGSRGAGCWRMAEQGRRHLIGDWPQADVVTAKTAGDPCNGYAGTAIGVN